MRKFILVLSLSLFFFSCEKISSHDKIIVEDEVSKTSDIYGRITDKNGKSIEGVVVSDGYSVCITNEKGIYEMRRGPFSFQVYMSIPEGYELPYGDDGHLCFWKNITELKRYDFSLTKLNKDENEFNLFCIADPQCQNIAHVDRFNKETVPDISALVADSKIPSYGVVLGDVCFNTPSTDYAKDIMPLMKVAFMKQKTNLPLFVAIGNHDNQVTKTVDGKYDLAHDISAQRVFEYSFGPINYSFNRGRAHIVVMDNILYTDQANYKGGFRDDQVEWLKKDLEYVSKDKLLILCVHIPLRGLTSNNIQQVKNLLAGFSEMHIMSGHTHYAENYVTEDHYEHVHGAACGAWWNSTINTDGTPNGYGVYRIKGASIVDNIYKATGEDKDHQLRIYDGEQTFKSYGFYYNSPNTVVANIWNADNDWVVKVFVDDLLIGEMSPFASSVIRRDAWASGYHRGVLGKSSTYDRTANTHMYYLNVGRAFENIKVVAIDGFGNQYEETYITTNSSVDYPVFN